MGLHVEGALGHNAPPSVPIYDHTVYEFNYEVGHMGSDLAQHVPPLIHLSSLPSVSAVSVLAVILVFLCTQCDYVPLSTNEIQH